MGKTLSRHTVLATVFAMAMIGLGPSPLPAGPARSRQPLPALVPVSDWNYYEGVDPDVRKIELGRLLFFDKILSGNRNISCATCHHPRMATGDEVSLPVGEGGRGQGVARDTGSGRQKILERVPRNAPPLFNLGAREFRRMFHDGRVEVSRSQPSGFRSPAKSNLPLGLDNVLAAQAMFPVTSAHEMAGHEGENPIADAAARGRRSGPGGVWQLLAARLREIPEYVERFRTVFNDVQDPRDLTFVHAANAIAAFEASAFRADRSPFDEYLRGNSAAMTLSARRGMRLFYGRVGCSTCHGGVFQTDHGFHAIGMPQIGPGKGDGPDGRDDFGREQVTNDPSDRYRFRTPSLRNVVLTGPWGHAGAYTRLDEVIVHHLYPASSLSRYDAAGAVLASRPDLDAIDAVVLHDPQRVAAIAEAGELPRVDLSRRQVGDLLEFLWALTDPRSTQLEGLVPRRVPSGLPLDD